MLISTRGRYALRVLADIAEHSDKKYVPMKEVAQRQNISLKYLERILPVLTKNGFVKGVKGKGGGYRLIKAPEECRLGDILRLTEGDLAPVACLGSKPYLCDKAAACRTYPVWEEFYKFANDYFDSKTLADIIKTDTNETYEKP